MEGFGYLLIACVLVGPAYGQLKDCRLQTIVDDFWLWRLENVPEFASSVNIRDFQDTVESYNMDQFVLRKQKVDGYLRRLRLINRDVLANSDRVTYDVLVDTLQTYADGYKWRYYGPMTPFNRMGGPLSKVSDYLALSSFDTEQDYLNFLSRMQQFTQRIYDGMARMNKSIEMGTTNHEVSMSNVIQTIDKTLAYTETTFPWYSPFDSDLDEKAWNSSLVNDLKARARSNIADYLNAMRDLRKYMDEVYMPTTRQEYGVWSLPDGEAYYRACLKWHLSIDVTAEEVHNMGLAEVARVSKEMEKTIKELGFDGTMQEFFADLKTKEEFKLSTSEDVLNYYRTFVKDRVQSKMEAYFRDIPDIPLEIKAMPYDGPFAIYKNGAPDGSRPGVLYVHVENPEENPTYDIPVLALHEADPGHHLQDSYALTSPNLPDFRKSTDFSKYWAVPLHFPFYTAYSEGWALYSESLGEELSIYKDGYEKMGRYGSEIFRACRLVVDTGIHHYKWSRETAINYMLNYTSYTQSKIEREIDRYITWPGQATSYTFGMLKFAEYRRMAQDALAENGHFNLRDFHYLLLDSGAMPLSVMKAVVQDWIDSEKIKYCIDVPICPTAAASTNHSVPYILIVALALLWRL